MGRAPKFKTPEELISKIEKYFTVCENDKSMPTKAGLALALDCHRDTLNEYVNNKDEEYSDAIKRAYTVIENAWTQKLAGANAAGSIFYLKAAFQYRDRVDVTSNDKELPTPLLHVLHNNSNEETTDTEEEN